MLSAAPRPWLLADQQALGVVELFHALDREGRLAPFDGPLSERAITR